MRASGVLVLRTENGRRNQRWRRGVILQFHFTLAGQHSGWKRKETWLAIKKIKGGLYDLPSKVVFEDFEGGGLVDDVLLLFCLFAGFAELVRRGDGGETFVEIGEWDFPKVTS